MPRKFIAAVCLTLACLGLAAGLLSAPARADNPQGVHAIDDLWPLGYTIGLRGIGPVDNPYGCSNLIVLSANGVPFPDGEEPIIELNPDPNKPDCRTPQDQIQANIDALLATYPPPAAAAPVTTDETPASTPAPPVTTTDATATDTAPAETAPAPAATTTPDPPVSEPTTTDAASQDALTAAVDAGASAPVAALAARSAGENAAYSL